MIQAIATVLDLAPAEWSPSTRMVAIAIADRVNEDWQAWPSVADLARRTGIGERQVQRHLAVLETAGVIRRERQRMVNGRPVSNLCTWLWRTRLGVSPMTPPGCHP